MGKKVKLSVIIATYNRCQDLKGVLESLLRQQYPEDLSFEILVVDNNSQDDTQQIVQDYIPQFHGRLRYLFESHQGKTFALNYGIKEARGEIIAMTDDDCIIDPYWMSKAYETCCQHDIDLLNGKIIPIFNTPKPDWVTVEHFEGPLVRFDMGDQYVEGYNNRTCRPGANLILRKTSIEKYGNFQLPGRAQDTELCHRWKRLGAKFGYAPELIVYHKTDALRLTRNYVRRWYFVSGQQNIYTTRDDYTQGRKLFRIPLWLYKKCMINFFRAVISFVTLDKHRLQKEVYLWQCLGAMCELSGIRTKFDHLR